MKNFIFLLSLITSSSITVNAQYFGRNKPVYNSFDFSVRETEHFRIHHYISNPVIVDKLAATSEQWYTNHKKIFGKDIGFKNPVIFYNSHPDFQQTNTISGAIGIGTGGVTEALKNRVVMPLGFSNQSTHHVLAHELVHAFQFNNVQTSDSTSLQNLANLPLWMIEGMAEYLSLGRIDPFTSMWMRDAILNNNLPEIQKMNDFKYFPYRYGHALMAYLGGTYGDQIINPLFMRTGVVGVETAIEEILGQDIKALSLAWHEAMKRHYLTYMPSQKEKPQGRRLITSKNGGRMNLSPSISPNGKYIIFLSEKDLFSTDLYLAEVSSGKILNKVTSLSQSGDLDYINVMESSGSWSPNSKDFVFTGIKKGRNVLVFKDADTGKTQDIKEIEGVTAFANPTFDPEGKNILMTGLVDGQTDLFEFNIKSGKVKRLTNDMYSENMAVYSPDGKSVYFCYDKKSVDEGRKNGRYTYGIAVMDRQDQSIEILNFFHGADNLNPVFDFEGNFYFVSDRDGLRNLYKYEVNSRRIYQMTDLMTGISGISGHSPMISASTKRDKVVYTHYINSQYELVDATSDKLLARLVEDVQNVDLTAGTLPSEGTPVYDIVGDNFRTIDARQYFNNLPTKNLPYKPNFKLDYITGGIGMGSIGATSSNFRNAQVMQGGVAMVFSDLLGNNQLFGQVALNGEVTDAAGMFSYINTKNRIAWGIGIGHIPLRTGYQTYGNKIVDIGGAPLNALVVTTNLIRVFDETVNFFAQFPFSTTLRLEAGIAGQYRSFRWDEYNDYYAWNQFGGYNFLGSDRTKVETGESLQIDQYYTILKGPGASANVALVGDNSFFGFTAPLAGQRYRFGVEHFIRNDKYTAFIADYRKYFWFKPVSLALRSTNFIRFEKETNSVYPFYIGNIGFVRGLGGILGADIESQGFSWPQVLGSKMMLSGAELRMPFTGPKELAIIPIKGFISDLNLFYDAGVVFDRFNEFSDGKLIYGVLRDDNGELITDNNGNVAYGYQTVKPLFLQSVGISWRINLFGALIIEPYYARILTKGSKFNFGLNILPGW